MEMAASNSMVDFFLQLLQMTKRMAEDVIPDQLLGLDKTALQQLTQASKEANSSLVVFEKLCNIFLKKDLAELNSKNSSQDHLAAAKQPSAPKPTVKNPVDKKAAPASSQIPAKEQFLWKDVLEKIRSRREDNQMVKDMFYCGFCHVHADSSDVWNSHLGGKRHKDLSDRLINEVRSHFCSTCYFFVIANSEDLDTIFLSPEHQQLDKMFLPVKQNRRLVESNANDSSAPISKNLPSNDQTVEIPTKAPTSKAPAKVTHLGTVISEQFMEIQCLIERNISEHREFTLFFCRPCQTVETSLVQWKEHIAEAQHVKYMSNKAFKNMRAMCNLCRFGMIASKGIAVSYMLYHVEKCHGFSVEANHVEEYVDIRELASTLASRGMRGSRSSFKGSCESVGSARHSRQPTPSSGRSTPQEQPRRRASPAMSSENGLAFNIPPGGRRESASKASDSGSTAGHPAVQQWSDSGQVDGDDDLALFVKMLDSKERFVRSNPSYKAFSALCLLCPQVKIVDLFSWSDHVGSHQSNEDQNEVECSECNTFVFGNLQTITEVLIPHPRHCQIDAFMSHL